MTNLMARIGPDTFGAQHLGENNSVKYRLTVKGSSASSKVNTPSVTLNGANIMATPGRGMNLIVINADTMGVVEQRAFDIYGNAEHRTTIQTYITGLPANRIVAMFSHDALLSSPSLDAYMASIGSMSWLGNGYMNRSDPVPNADKLYFYRSSYSAIYNSNMKKIVMEDVMGAVGMGPDTSRPIDNRTSTDIVFDTIDDIGATGIPFRLADDETEYSSTGEYTFHMYVSRKPLGDAKLKAGDIIYATAEMYVSKAALDAGAYGQMHVEGYNNAGTWLWGSPSPQVRVADQWTQIEYWTVVKACDNISAAAYHMPNDVRTGEIKVRNVTISQVSRQEKKTGNAGFGVNGIRATRLAEPEDFDNPIMQLLNLPTDVNNKVITSNKFSEVS